MPPWLPRPAGQGEALVVWVLCAALLAAIAVTYTRLPPGDLYWLATALLAVLCSAVLRRERVAVAVTPARR